VPAEPFPLVLEILLIPTPVAPVDPVAPFK